MSEVKVNKISPRTNCGTTTLGDSGDSFVIPSGVTITNNGTQTGFGRTGTVDWDTTAKTGNFTAVSGNGYFVNTTSGAITVTLPATPSAGDIVAIKDYANTADTNPITIARNGSNIDGGTADGDISNEGGSVTLVYVDATKGWLITDSAQKSDIVFPEYIVASGGTETTCGDYKIHTFTGPGTFTVCSVGNPFGSTTVDYLVVAGGAGGGGAAPPNCSNYAAGGGGAGGYRESSGTASGCYTASPLGACVSALPVTAQGYPITVGAGGAGGPTPTSPSYRGGSGSNSVFSTITSTGGGGGGNAGSGCNGVPGIDGGSGGGAGAATPNPAGSGNTPPVSPPQGNPGGTGTGSGNTGGGGGGGATVAGSNATGNPTPSGGDGGAGATTSISGTPTAYAGGGGGANGYAGGTGLCGGAGGLGGGGAGAEGPNPSPAAAVAGTANTGGGGGGTHNFPSTSRSGAAGGSGIVIIRYKYQ